MGLPCPFWVVASCFQMCSICPPSHSGFGWTLLLSALSAQQHSVHRLGMKHGRGRGTSSTFPMPWICAPCVRLIPCPGLSPACAQGRCQFVVTSWVKAVQTRSLPRLQLPSLPWTDFSNVRPRSWFGGSICLPLPCLVRPCSL